MRRPSSLSPLPEQARKAGKCSPSPTYPQAPQQTREIDINGNIRRGSAGGPKRSTSNHLTPKAPYKPAPAKAGGTRWDRVLLLLATYRLLAPGSEWRFAPEWVWRRGPGALSRVAP